MRVTSKPSRRQMQILAFVRECTARDGFPPNQTMICQAFGISPGTTHEHVTALEHFGFVRREGVQRGAMVRPVETESRVRAHVVESAGPLLFALGHGPKEMEMLVDRCMAGLRSAGVV